MFTHITAAMLVRDNRAPAQQGGSILGSENLRKPFRRISEVWANAETRDSKKCLFLPISYNTTISLLYPLDSFVA